MALLWFDGFESYNNAADMDILPNLKAYNINLATGRRGGRALYVGYENRYYMAEITGNPATVIKGFAFRLAGTPTYSAGYPFLRIYDALEGGNVHLNFYINSSRNIEVRNSAFTLLGTTSGVTIATNVWYYFEVKATINSSTGAVEIKIDETQRLNLTSQNTQNGANAYAGAMKFRQANVVGPYFDDLYICDTSGSKNNDFLGDVRIDILRPNAAGTYTDFTPSAGSNHENVDEAYGPDGDTTYNDGANVGDQDSYQMPDLPAPAGTTIYGVKTQGTVRKTDAGAMKCKLLTRAGTTDDLGDEIALSDSFVTHTEIFENNPDDSAAWEDADVNSMEPGVKITA